MIVCNSDDVSRNYQSSKTYTTPYEYNCTIWVCANFTYITRSIIWSYQWWDFLTRHEMKAWSNLNDQLFIQDEKEFDDDEKKNT